jgi:hypothetical protein
MKRIFILWHLKTLALAIVSANFSRQFLFLQAFMIRKLPTLEKFHTFRE